jgi:DNA-binding transcriptional regulator YhcF (GntR family)
MNIHINKKGEVPLHRQLREQIVFNISTGELPIGAEMPSMRECARVTSIHKNTVARVYNQLVQEGWLVGSPGRPFLVVARPQMKSSGPESDQFDDLIDRIIQIAQKKGYSLQDLTSRLRERLLVEAPDHLLIVEPEPGMGELMKEEIRESIGHAPETCQISALRRNPALAIGAVLLTPTYLLDGLSCIPTGHRNVVPISYSPMQRIIEAVNDLSQPSVLGVLSVSPAGLMLTDGLLGGLVGDLHSFQLFLMERPNSDGARRQFVQIRRFTPEGYRRTFVRRQALEAFESGPGRFAKVKRAVQKDLPEEDLLVSERDLRGVDLLFCDSITYNAVRHPRRIKYQLLSDKSLGEIASAYKALPGQKAKRNACSA